MKQACIAEVALSLGLLSACGNIDTNEKKPPEATLLLVRPPGQVEIDECPSFVDPTTASELFASSLASGEATVVELAKTRVIGECSGAGGTHIFSTAIADNQRFWLGAHACYPGVDTERFNTGVIVGLGIESPNLLQGQEGWCMNYPGEAQTFTTEISTQAMAWFPDEVEATRFLQSL